MEFHEVANIFPMMSKEELEELAADIKENGLIDAIWTYDGKIIDGRNRFVACNMVGETPRFQAWRGGSHRRICRRAGSRSWYFAVGNAMPAGFTLRSQPW